MQESNTLLNERMAAIEHQRNWALTEWARDRANLAIARAAITEQDAKIAALEAELATLKGEDHGRSD